MCPSLALPLVRVGGILDGRQTNHLVFMTFFRLILLLYSFEFERQHIILITQFFFFFFGTDAILEGLEFG